MAKILSFPHSAHKHGYRRVRRKRAPDLEKYGQLNMFAQPREAKVVQMTASGNPFEQALAREEENLPEEAERLYREAAMITAYAADANCNLGIMMSQKNDIAAAIDYFSQALVQDPRHFEAHYNLGNIYADQNNTTLAKLHYEIAIRISPSFDSAYFNLAVLLMQQGLLQEAEMRLMQYKALAEEADRAVAEELLKEIRNHLNKRHQL